MPLDFSTPLATCAPYCSRCIHHTERMYKKPFCAHCSEETYYDRIRAGQDTVPRRYECYKRYQYKTKRALNMLNQLTFNF